jgi:hypothetical protein
MHLIRRVWLIGVGLAGAFALPSLSCTSGLSASVDGRPCDAAGHCLSGYQCDPISRRCFRPESEALAVGGAAGADDGVASSDGGGASGTGNSGAAGANASCREGETVCSGKCVVLRSDAENCGGCGALCTAPAHGQPVCLASRCNFACDQSYVACGETCVDFGTDVDNCGACGKSCPATGSGTRTC